MANKLKTLGLCAAVCLLLCLGQVRGSTLLILAALGIFLLILGWACYRGNTLPILLFFLPWSSLMRLSTDSFSFYTVGLVLVCGIVLLKKRLNIRGRDVVIGLLLTAVTLISKLWEGYSISLSYIAFMMMIVMIFSVKQEEGEQYGFESVTLFFATGVVLAALVAQKLAEYPNIQGFIRVDSYSTITRWCGFYSDPNFYSAQISAVLSGVLILLLRSNGKRMIPLMTLAVLLIYCGLLSASKSFFLVVAVQLGLWLFLLFRARRSAGFKLVVILLAGVAVAVVFSTALFDDLVQTLLLRFSSADTLDSLTTGRWEIWKSYIQDVFRDPKMLLLGEGLTDGVLIDGKGSHNTVLQIVFQLGVVGTGLLVCWWMGLERRTLFVQVCRQNRRTEVLLLIVGAIMPWMALDLLLFDEFFLFQWYILLGIQHMVARGQMPESLPGGEKAAGDPDCTA